MGVKLRNWGQSFGAASRLDGFLLPEGLSRWQSVTLEDGPCERVRFGAAGVVGIGILSAGGAALQWLALVGPFEGLGHGAVEVVYKSFQSLLQIGQRGKVAAADDLAGQDAEPNFDLVHPGGMFGSVTKVNPMGGIVQEASAASRAT